MASSGQRFFADEVDGWRRIVGRPVTNAADLTANMQALYDAIYGAHFERLDPHEVKAIAPQAGEALFDLYLTLRDRLPEWSDLGLMSRATASSVRNAMRILRYTSDIVGEVGNNYATLKGTSRPYPLFGGPAGWTHMHPASADGTRPHFRSGDVLLVRGRLNNSAAIARIGDVDAQFSHTGLVHIDARGDRWMVEALIEDGAVFTPLDTALDHGCGRALLFRHRDPDLAHRAAEYAAMAVTKRRRGLRNWLPYDFTMRLDEGDEFFCSKLVRHGFLGATGGSLALPTYGTRLAMKNRDFFERIGVTAVETFAPADLEVEPAFDVVAEWRDYRVTSSLRMQDLLMTKLFEWMDERGYVFQEGLGIAAASLAGRFSSYWPDPAKRVLEWLGLPRIPANMTVRTIATIGMLQQTADPIHRRLMRLEEERIATTGRPLHPREVLAELDRLADNAGGRIGYLVAKS